MFTLSPTFLRIRHVNKLCSVCDLGVLVLRGGGASVKSNLQLAPDVRGKAPHAYAGRAKIGSRLHCVEAILMETILIKQWCVETLRYSAASFNYIKGN